MVSDCTYNGIRRDKYVYVGDEPDDFERWKNCEISTYEFQTITDFGEGTKSLVAPDEDDPCRMVEDATTSTVEEEPDGASTTINSVKRYNNTLNSSRSIKEVPERSGDNTTNFNQEQRSANSTTRVKTVIETVTVNRLNYPIVTEQTIDTVFDSVEGFNRVQAEVTSATNPINIEKDVKVLEASDTISTILTIEFLEPEETQQTPLDLFVRLSYKFGNLTSGKSSILITDDEESALATEPGLGEAGAFGALKSNRPGKKFF